MQQLSVRDLLLTGWLASSAILVASSTAYCEEIIVVGGGGETHGVSVGVHLFDATVTKRVAIKATNTPFVGSTGSVAGYSGTYSLDNLVIVQCPPNSFARGIQGFFPDGGLIKIFIIGARIDCVDPTNPKPRNFKGTDDLFVGQSGSVAGYSGTYSLDNTDIVQCPQGSFVGGIQGFYPQDTGYIRGIRYDCRDDKGKRLDIKGTDGPFVGSTGSVAGYSGTYSLDNTDIVQCPQGSFVAGIQGFLPSGFPLGFAQIRYDCRSF